jgi:alkylation response protein AidB-like acyl-CoA dehydrogenase
MDFRLSTEQIDVQKAAEEFAKGEFDPDAALEYDEKQEFPSSIWKKACEWGYTFLKNMADQDLAFWKMS